MNVGRRLRHNDVRAALKLQVPRLRYYTTHDPRSALHWTHSHHPYSTPRFTTFYCCVLHAFHGYVVFVTFYTTRHFYSTFIVLITLHIDYSEPQSSSATLVLFASSRTLLIPRYLYTDDFCSLFDFVTSLLVTFSRVTPLHIFILHLVPRTGWWILFIVWSSLPHTPRCTRPHEFLHHVITARFAFCTFLRSHATRAHARFAHAHHAFTHFVWFGRIS